MPRAFTSTASFRFAAIAVVVLASLGAGYLIVGPRPAEPAPQAAEATSGTGAPLRPSYLVSVRQPTPEEMAQRKALSDVKPVQRPIELAPQVAAEPEPTGPAATVLSDVNVRSGPGTGSAVMSVASTGSKVQVLEQQGGWTRVTLPDGSPPSSWRNSRAGIDTRAAATGRSDGRFATDETHRRRQCRSGRSSASPG